MSDIIRKAVELADGFSTAGLAGLFLHMDVKDEEFPYHIQTSLDKPAQFFLDALAAQLVRQVDSETAHRLDIGPCGSVLMRGSTCQIIAESPEPPHLCTDRTMNTITAIVESGVLSDE